MWRTAASWPSYTLRLDSIVQTSVRLRAGLTFKNGASSALLTEGLQQAGQTMCVVADGTPMRFITRWYLWLIIIWLSLWFRSSLLSQSNSLTATFYFLFSYPHYYDHGGAGRSRRHRKSTQPEPYHVRNTVDSMSLARVLYAKATSAFRVSRTMVCYFVFRSGRHRLCNGQGARVDDVSCKEIWE